MSERRAPYLCEADRYELLVLDAARTFKLQRYQACELVWKLARWIRDAELRGELDPAPAPLQAEALGRPERKRAARRQRTAA